MIDQQKVSTYKVTAKDEQFNKVGGGTISVTLSNGTTKLRFVRGGDQSRIGKNADGTPKFVTTEESRTLTVDLTYKDAFHLEHDGYEVTPSPIAALREDYAATEAAEEQAAARQVATDQIEHDRATIAAEQALPEPSGVDIAKLQERIAANEQIVAAIDAAIAESSKPTAAPGQPASQENPESTPPAPTERPAGRRR